MKGLLQDLRYGLRQLRKSLGFSTVAVLTLALGIAVNATMFSLVSAFLLRPPSGRDPQRIAVVSSVDPRRNFLPDAALASVPNYLAWRDANHVFSEMAAADEYRSVNLAAQGRPEVIPSAAVSANYFSLLGVEPLLGRAFLPGEDESGRDHVVILSHALWEQRFHSDPSILQSTMRLNRENYTVIGVMRSDLHMLGFTPQLWTPLVFSAYDRSAAARKDHALHVFARLKPGASLADANAELLSLSTRAEKEFPAFEKGWSTSVRALPDFLVHNFGIRPGLLVIMTTVAFVLLIACANVAGLLLTRAVGRQKEIGLRISLGATRARIVRQLLCEGLLISLIGGSAGLLFAYWGIHFVQANLIFNDAIKAVPLSLDRNVLLFAFAASVVSALLSGLAPALKSARPDVNSTLKDESRGVSAGRSQSRLRGFLVTAEIAMALFLLIGAGLLIRGVFLIEHQYLGFRSENLLTAGITLDAAQYSESSRQSLFVQNLLARLKETTGVEVAAATSALPATGADGVAFRIQGQPDTPSDRHAALAYVVTPDYFGATGIPVLQGRAFNENDDARSPRVVIINQEFVRRHFASTDPIGKQIRFDSDPSSTTAPDWRQIVGVVGSVKSYSEDARIEPQIYEPFAQHPVASFSLVLRAASNPAALASSLRAVVSQADSELPLSQIITMDGLVELQRSGNPFFSRILATFALLALLLASIGVYGLIAYSVGLRTREIGVRMALGARRPDVLRMILIEGVKTAVIGSVIGLLFALPLPKAFDSMFSTLHFREPALYFIVPIVILFVALLATWIPARRASKLDPLIALRYE